jgi:hypothetical protein
MELFSRRLARELALESQGQQGRRADGRSPTPNYRGVQRELGFARTGQLPGEPNRGT